MNVEFLEGGDLAEVFLFEVVGPEIRPLVFVAVGDEVQGRAVPHGLGVARLVAGEIPGGEGLQVKEPDGGVHAAAVALPGRKIHRDGHVGEGAAVGGNGAKFAVGDGQLFGQPSLHRDGIQLVEPVFLARSGGSEQQLPSVRVPFQHAVQAAVVGQPPGQPAGDRHDVNIRVAVVVAAEGDLAAVGGESREGFLTPGGTQPLGLAAGLGHDPNVPRVNENDVGGGHVRVAEHARVRRGVNRLLGPGARPGAEQRARKCDGKKSSFGHFKVGLMLERDAAGGKSIPPGAPGNSRKVLSGRERATR